MRLIGEVVRSIAGDLRETWPGDEREAGVFLAGMAWAFVLFWAMLLLVSWLYLRAIGGH